MFIITLGDVFGLIFLGGVIIWIIYSLISGAKASSDMRKNNSIEYKAKQKEASEAPKKDAEAPLTKKDRIIYIIIFLFFIALFIAWRYAHDNGL